MHKNEPHRRTEADLSPDLVAWVRAHFPKSDTVTALEILVAAVIHTGEYPDARLLRSAALGSAAPGVEGDLDRLRYYVGLLAIDWRDVIVAGEYAAVNHQLVRVRDFTLPIPPDTDPPATPE